MTSKTKGKHQHSQHSDMDITKQIEDPLDEQELEALYAWVDEVPLSRPKRNISRDFSDGVLVAELLHHYFQKEGLVQMHHFTTANGTNKKKYNWYHLNRYVFSRLHFELADEVINDLCCCKPGMIEKVLLMLQVKIKNATYAKEHQNDKPEADQHQPSPGRKDGRVTKVGMEGMKGKGMGKGKQNEDYGHVITQRYLDNKGWNSGEPKQTTPSKAAIMKGVPKKRIGPIMEPTMVPVYVLEEKEQEVLSRDETIQILQAKISRLEHLLHLKDMRIEDLQGRVESMRPTGIKK